MSIQKRVFLKKVPLAAILAVFAVAQFAAIMYFNYVKAYGYWDYDAPLALRHGVEMWRNGIFLKDFNYYSTMEIDCVGFFAAPIYMATGNLGLALSLCHSVFYFLIVWLFFDIGRNAGASGEQVLLTVLLFFTPYSVRSLEWVQMLFASVAQYEFRVIVLLLLLDLILMSRAEKVSRVKFTATFLIYLVFNFWTSLSTGNYVLCMIILPFLLEGFIYCLCQPELKLVSRGNLVLLASCLVSLMGYILRVRLVGESDRNNLSVIVDENYLQNLQAAVIGVYDLFGGLSLEEGISVFSVNGIGILIRYLFLTVCVLAAVKYVLGNKEKNKSLSGCFLAVLLVNFGVLIVADTNYGGGIFESRYHILWCVMLLIIAGFSLMSGKLWKNGRLNILTPYAAALILALINLTGFIAIQTVDESNVSRQYERTIIELAKDNGVNSVFVYDQVIPAACIRAMDLDMYCVSVKFRGTNSIMGTGDMYTAYFDNSANDGPNILVCPEEDFQELPEFVRQLYRLVDDTTLENAFVYYADKSMWDGVAGLPVETENYSVDYPYSPQYAYQGRFDWDGRLVADSNVKGYILWGPNEAVIPGTYNITLYYQLAAGDEENATFEISTDVGKTILLRESLVPGETAFTFQNVELTGASKLEYRVWKSQDTVIAIEKIVFERVSSGE